ncbi:MAG: hypothetical protein AAB152_00120 [Candidatus Coatesbacteria bacterium]
MARGGFSVCLLVLWTTFWPSSGRAATAWGTVITNVATITMSSGAPDFVGYQLPYNMTCTVPIMPASSIRVLKYVVPAIESPGGTLTYTIWYVNRSASASSFNIVATDALPANVAYDLGRGSWNGGSGGTWASLYSSNNVTYAGGQPAAGQSEPCYLRFVLDWLGPAKSALISYSVTIR